MPQINDARAVHYANSVVRPTAQALANAFAQARLMASSATAVQMATIPDTNDVIVDGSPADGRHPITGSDVHEMLELMAAIDALAMADNGRFRNLIARVAPMFNRATT